MQILIVPALQDLPVGGPAFVMRVREEQERQLYVRREIHIGVRRDWTQGSKILLVRKTAAGDAFVGSGIFEKIVGLEEMAGEEKRRCVENNWYGRIAFARLARFQPPVPVQGTILAGKPPALLHGLEMSEGEAESIEALVNARIIT